MKSKSAGMLQDRPLAPPACHVGPASACVAAHVPLHKSSLLHAAYDP